MNLIEFQDQVIRADMVQSYGIRPMVDWGKGGGGKPGFVIYLQGGHSLEWFFIREWKDKDGCTEYGIEHANMLMDEFDRLYKQAMDL